MPLSPFRSVLCYALLLLLAPATSLAAPGEVDFAFGNGGTVQFNLDGAFKIGRAVAVQTDGKIVVGVQGGGDFDVLRFLPNGQLDPAFGTDGRVTTDLGTGSDDSVRTLAIQPDGKILMSGTSDFKAAVVRYESTGVLDTGFGSAGIVLADFGGSSVSASHTVLLSSGKIIVVAAVDESAGLLGVARFNDDGTPDTGFNAQGFVVVNVGHDFFHLNGAAVHTDGSIVAVATTNNSGRNGLGDTLLIRLTSAGALDTTLGGTGTVVGIGLALAAKPTCVAIQPDGKILVGGYIQQGSSGFARDYYNVTVTRYETSGALDGAFGNGGTTVSSFGEGQPILEGIALQPDGKIVAATGFSEVLVLRYTAAGNLDLVFGNGGIAGTLVVDAEVFTFGATVQTDGRITVTGFRNFLDATPVALFVSRFFGGDPAPFTDPPVVDTKADVTGEPAGTRFLSFNAPAVDDGMVGGAARITGTGQPQTVIYGGDGSVLVRTGGMDPVGAQFIAIGDPVFGGEALGFKGTALQPAPTTSLPMLLDARLQLSRGGGVQAGGRLEALYSQLTRLVGIVRLAAQADPAPGGGQFAKFGGFGLPRNRGGLVFAANLHRSGGVTKADDFGVWREKAGGGDSDLLLRNGQVLLLPGGGSRDLKKVTVMAPVPQASDQRRSFAPDGGVAALASFADGSSGVVQVAPDGGNTVPLETSSAVPDEEGDPLANAEFRVFQPPATASGGRLALLANLRAIAAGQPLPPSQAIFSSTGGALRRRLAQGDTVPGREGIRFATLGQPLLGQQGMIGLVAALTGRRVTPANRQAITLLDDGVRAVVARLGDPAPGAGPRVTFRRFMSVVVTDSDPARLLFTATIGGKGLKASNNTGLWSVSKESGTTLLLRKGGSIMAGGETLSVRTLDALQAPRKNMGQGRSTDEDGFVTVKVKLSDGRKGVLRIPLP